MHKKQRQKKRFITTNIIAGGFLAAIVAGTLLLSLPFSTADGHAVPLVDALFTATTSVCVTGLVTLPTYSTWSFFGQAVILILIELGGLGIITFTTLSLMILGRRIGLKGRLLIQDAYNLDTIQGLVRMVRKILAGSVIVEGTGALLYLPVLVPRFGPAGIWKSIFLSVSAFCNAGMDLLGEDSLAGYASNPLMVWTTMFLIVVGGIGFPIWWELLGHLREFRTRRFRQGRLRPGYSLQARIVLWMTSGLILAGAVVVFILEYDNPRTLGAFSFWGKIQGALFQSVTLRTAGFFTVPQEGLRTSTALFACLFMFIGGSPSGTAGGIKTTTIFILVLTILSILRDHDDTETFSRKISSNTVRRAMAIFGVSFVVFLLSLFFLTAASSADFLDCLYESVSAVGTVGLSRNLTGSLPAAGKLVIIGTMYLGRIGPISLALFFNGGHEKSRITYPEEHVSVG